MSPRLPPPIVALTPGDRTATDALGLVRTVGRAWEAGLRGVVLREIGVPDRVYLELALAVRRVLSRESGGWLCLHDRPHLATAASADAVHFGGRSLPIREVRAWIEREIAIGLSTHAGDDASAWREADYLFHGPVRPTAKTGARAPIGFDGLARAVASTERPIWALGGLQPSDAASVIEAGGRGIAVLSGILAREDVTQRAREYVEAWERSAQRP